MHSTTDHAFGNFTCIFLILLYSTVHISMTYVHLFHSVKLHALLNSFILYISVVCVVCCVDHLIIYKTANCACCVVHVGCVLCVSRVGLGLGTHTTYMLGVCCVCRVCACCVGLCVCVVSMCGVCCVYRVHARACVRVCVCNICMFLNKILIFLNVDKFPKL